jgi:hypothetical protein
MVACQILDGLACKLPCSTHLSIPYNHRCLILLVWHSRCILNIGMKHNTINNKENEAIKVKTLKFKGFRIEGMSDLTLWGGGNACITMIPFFVKHLREIRENINDAQFGVESINGAICDIKKVYQNGHGEYSEYVKTVYVGHYSDHTLDSYHEN